MEADWASLKSFLESSPLYRDRDFSTAGILTQDGGLFLVSGPDALDLPCARCTKQQKWQLREPWERFIMDPFGEETIFPSIHSSCRNCVAERLVYFVRAELSASHDRLRLTKVGQFPALERQPASEISSALTKEDLAHYRAAMTCRNSNYGIGALAYLRRIVENRMNDLLDLVVREVTSEGGEVNPGELDRIRQSRRFSDKITFAAKLLPESARPGGANPIEVLHDLASDGIHARSDSECADTFDRCKLAFEHTITELKHHQDKAEEFKREMAKLLSHRATKAS